MTEENKPYQLTYLLSPLLDQKKIEEISQKLKKWIIEKGGSLAEKGNSSLALKKNLAYPLKKYRQAFYLNLNFLLAGQTVGQLGQQLNLEKDILRYFITTKQKLKTKPPHQYIGGGKPIREAIDHKIVDRIEPLVDKPRAFQEKALGKQIPLSEKSAKDKTAPEKKEKVKIEELDKKLEEILNQ